SSLSLFRSLLLLTEGLLFLLQGCGERDIPRLEGSLPAAEQVFERLLVPRGRGILQKGLAAQLGAGSRFVDQVDGLVGKEPVVDVAHAHPDRRLQRLVFDHDAVMRFVERAEALRQKQEAAEKRRRRRRGGKPAVRENDIAAVVSVWTGVPAERIAEEESRRLAKLESILHKRVVGQEEAVRAVARAVRRGRVGLKDPARPIGSFLFLGPTGVGTTELTKAIAEFLFDDDQAMVRIDMSEFMEKHSVSRLIGAPPGYVGYDEGGVLTEAIRRRPYQVILFDEGEKAHPDVFNVLLQVLDDGRLTDGQGRTVDFRNTLIVLTSNLGSSHLAALRDGESAETVRDKVMEDVRAAFRPEFLNRLDEILLFNRLSRASMTDIVEIQLNRLRKLLVDRKIGLDIDAKALQWLANRGYDPVYGARPLKRVIQRSLQNPLASLLLEGKVKDGDTVAIGVENGELTVGGHRVMSEAAD
ncbi:MAG: AAA family ATPase, partial [Reyranella sp.]|nr:AAA family ATPase [Reyranella sp.]